MTLYKQEIIIFPPYLGGVPLSGRSRGVAVEAPIPFPLGHHLVVWKVAQVNSFERKAYLGCLCPLIKRKQ
jgi:hypothetical protein